MYYYLYEIKNLLTGKIYIGIHQTKNLNDGYMGSGSNLISDIKKYGIENFEKRVLHTFDDEESMKLAEEMYVDKTFLSRSDVYNIVEGGGGGWAYVNAKFPKKPKSSETRQKISKTLKENYPETTREAVRVAAKRPKSEEQKRKTSLKMKGRTVGPKSEDYKETMRNLIWITNGIEVVRINKEKEIPAGWRRGRKLG